MSLSVCTLYIKAMVYIIVYQVSSARNRFYFGVDFVEIKGRR